MNKRISGFTIVELLIVIVVIGILAAISIVAYNGISNQANDTAIKSDLSDLAKKAKIFQAENGRYPNRIDFFSSARDISISKSAYDHGLYNLYYCTDTGSYSSFGIAARSKSGQTYTISSTDNLAKNSLAPQWQVACGAFGENVLSNTEFDYGYNFSSRTWKSTIRG